MTFKSGFTLLKQFLSNDNKYINLFFEDRPKWTTKTVKKAANIVNLCLVPKTLQELFFYGKNLITSGSCKISYRKISDVHQDIFYRILKKLAHIKPPSIKDKLHWYFEPSVAGHT